MTSVTVRSATETDLPRLQALLDRCSADTTYRRFHGAIGGAVRRELERISHPGPEHRSWIATDGTDIRGTATLARGSNGVVEAAFLVEDAWFRQGIGRALFAALAREAMSSGTPEVTAWVQADNERARRFLRSMVPGTTTTFAGGGELEISLPVGARSGLHGVSSARLQETA
jgi:N-acetylglutamate synthase-like GNAT family acetyltransferase